MGGGGGGGKGNGIENLFDLVNIISNNFTNAT